RQLFLFVFRHVRFSISFSFNPFCYWSPIKVFKSDLLFETQGDRESLHEVRSKGRVLDVWGPKLLRKFDRHFFLQRIQLEWLSAEGYGEALGLVSVRNQHSVVD